MLASAGLRDDARLAHAQGEQYLPEAVVDLMRAGVVEVFTLQINLCAAKVLGQPLREIERIGTADIVLEQPVQFGMELGIVLGFVVSLLQIEHERH